jgi:outer membrane lipoprotein-sorting protein
MSELLGQMTSLMRGDFKASQETFTVSALQGRDYRIVLTPRVKALGEYIRAIELTLDRDRYQVSKIVIREPEGDFIQIVFSDVRENVPFARELFDTKNPALKNESHREKK